MPEQRKQLFYVGHLRSERDAMTLGMAICALPKVEKMVCGDFHVGPARVDGDVVTCEACGAILRDDA